MPIKCRDKPSRRREWLPPHRVFGILSRVFEDVRRDNQAPHTKLSIACREKHPRRRATLTFSLPLRRGNRELLVCRGVATWFRGADPVRKLREREGDGGRVIRCRLLLG